MLEIGLTHVEQRLARHGRVLRPVLFGHERQHALHQRRLASRRGALDDHRQRRLQLPRHRGQISGELVRLLAHHSRDLEVGQDAVEQPRVLEQVERGLPLGRVERDLLGRRLQDLPDLGVLELLELQEHLAEVLLEGVVLEAELGGGLLDEGGPVPGRVEIEGVDVEGVGARRQDVDLHDVVGRVLVEASDPIPAISQPDDHLSLVDLGGDLHCRGWQRRCCRGLGRRR